jgi:hypothetical protein
VSTTRGIRGIRAVAATAVAAVALPLALGACAPQDTAVNAPATTAPGAACQHVGTVSFDKAKFLLHAGLAYGAFHHFILGKIVSGAFRAGAPGRLTNAAEAALAGAFTVHELKLARQDAESDPTLCKIVAPFDQAGAALSGMTDKLRSGDATQQDVQSVDSTLTSVGDGIKKAGMSIVDQLPSPSQLVNPGN